MLFALLDVPPETWLERDHHLSLLVIAGIAVLVLAGIFIYRRIKRK